MGHQSQATRGLHHIISLESSEMSIQSNKVWQTIKYTDLELAHWREYAGRDKFVRVYHECGRGLVPSFRFHTRCCYRRRKHRARQPQQNIEKQRRRKVKQHAHQGFQERKLNAQKGRQEAESSPWTTKSGRLMDHCSQDTF